MTKGYVRQQLPQNACSMKNSERNWKPSFVLGKDFVVKFWLRFKLHSTEAAGELFW